MSTQTGRSTSTIPAREGTFATTSTAEKTRFFVALMRKYGDPAWDRPTHFFPRLDDVTVYAVTIDRMTGKETALPGVSERWPALDRTKSPRATPPPAP